MRAVQLNAYGDPAASVGLVDLPEPTAPGPNEVLVAIEFAPVNPADLLLIRGYYAVRPPLPSVIGNEGVGKIISVGPGVTNVKVGDRVAAPLSSFTWRERMLMAAKGLHALPPEADPKQLAMVAVNPVTAFLLLNEFKTLEAGDWILQNAANSGVGRSIIAIARERALKTVNIVRRPELVAELLAAGGDVVIVDGPDIAWEIAAATGNAELSLAFDCLSGGAMAQLGSLLSYAGTLVSYGAMSGSPATLNPGDLIYKSLTLKSFFLGHPHHAEKFPALIAEAAKLIAEGKLHVPVAGTYPLSAIEDAIAHVEKGGKVLLNVTAG